MYICDICRDTGIVSPTDIGAIPCDDCKMGERVKQIAELQEKLNKRCTECEWKIRFQELKDTIHRRNLQIADLKKKISELSDWDVRNPNRKSMVLDR